ncbi:MAG: DUF362 domain-containing protein [Nanobdellota archaeon]
MNVSVKKCTSYDEVKNSIRKALDELGGIEKFVKSTDKVLLKPNLCNPVKDAVTHPEFIKGMIEIVKEITPNVFVADFPAVNEPDITVEVLKKTGIMDVLKETKTKYSNIEYSGFVAKPLLYYKVLEKTDFAKIFFHVDVVINLPKLKTHGVTYLTGAVKNLMGLIHMDERNYLHKNFDKDGFSNGLLDILTFLRPKIKLNVMDAVEAMEGFGPVEGDMINFNRVIASEDALSLDFASSEMTGHKLELMPILKAAKKRKMLSPVGDFKRQQFKQHPNYGRDNDLVPWIDENCKNCGNCVKSCPADAIIQENGKLKIKEDECIKCYCCIENCKYKCIHI